MRKSDLSSSQDRSWSNLRSRREAHAAQKWHVFQDPVHISFRKESDEVPRCTRQQSWHGGLPRDILLGQLLQAKKIISLKTFLFKWKPTSKKTFLKTVSMQKLPQSSYQDLLPTHSGAVEDYELLAESLHHQEKMIQGCELKPRLPTTHQAGPEGHNIMWSR